MPANPVQPHSEKKRVAKEVMEESGLGGIIEPKTTRSDIPDNTELFGNVSQKDLLLPYNDLPNGWGITYVKNYGDSSVVYVGVGPV